MLDTSVLIGPIPDEVIDAIEEHAASFIVRAELLRGHRHFERSEHLRPAARARAQLVATLDRLPGFWRPFGEAESDAYAALTTQSERAVRSKDALIAAHAIALDVPLITADEGFTRFAGLRVITV
jgi:predicted nucleic acid-binding protein